MLLRLPRRSIGTRYFVLAIPTILFCLWILLPYDNSIRQAVRFNVDRLFRSFDQHSYESWVLAPPRFPVDLKDDVLIILKTGYGTRHRLGAWFEALSSRSELGDIIIIGDYASTSGQHIHYGGKTLEVHNVVNRTIQDLALDGQVPYPRITKYETLVEAIARGDEDEAMKLSKSFGWELDSMKDISGLELAYERYPQKKWYILLDDDTYLVQPSIKPLLGHLGSQSKFYLGNAVGDYRARFAHGGSSIILSQGAIYRLFANPTSVSTALVESLTTIWGDRLIARALIRVGVFLDEHYSRFFSGEPPRFSRITADRICAPVATFHGLSSPTNMLEVGKQFNQTEKPFIWARLLDMFQVPSQWRHGQVSIRPDWDYVGRSDVAVVTVHGIFGAEACAQECEKRLNMCIAWTWEGSAGDCYLSPWALVGEGAKGKVSGISAQRARRLEAECVEY
ncbi:hypothetical protein OQA88_6816 [Cercophora sp. LCS_1]